MPPDPGNPSGSSSEFDVPEHLMRLFYCMFMKSGQGHDRDEVAGWLVQGTTGPWVSTKGWTPGSSPGRSWSTFVGVPPHGTFAQAHTHPTEFDALPTDPDDYAPLQQPVVRYVVSSSAIYSIAPGAPQGSYGEVAGANWWKAMKGTKCKGAFKQN
jgi:hypothetical protein